MAFAKARLLRLGIILKLHCKQNQAEPVSDLLYVQAHPDLRYGFNVSVQQILTMGPGSFCSALAMVFSTLAGVLSG